MYFTGLRFYSGLLQTSIPNFGMIAETVFRESDYGISLVNSGDIGEEDGINDGLWCQSGGVSGTKEWIVPSGIQAPNSTTRSPLDPVYTETFPNQIGLLRPHSVTTSNGLEGLYNCNIYDENDNRQAMWIWISSLDIFNSINGND